MERNQKIMLVVGIAATAALVGWAIYASTQSALEEGGEEGGGASEEGTGTIGTSTYTGDSPKGIFKHVKHPNGTATITYNDGTTRISSKAEQDSAVKAGTGRGADGSRSWSNATGYIC